MSDKDENIISENSENSKMSNPKRNVKRENVVTTTKNENNIQSVLPPLKPQRQIAVIPDDIITPKKQISNDRLNDIEYIKTVSCL